MNKKFNKGYIVALAITCLFIFMMLFPGNNTYVPRESTSYSDFLTSLEDHKISNVEIASNKISYQLDGDETVYSTTQIYDPNLVDRLQDAGVEFSAVATTNTNTGMSSWMAMLLPWLLIWLVGWWLIRRTRRRISSSFSEANKNAGEEGDDQGGFPFGGGFGGFNPMGKSNAKMYKAEMTGTLFKDVAGQEEAKNNLQEIVTFLHEPSRYNAIGAKMPKGILLVGPPGTGKTLLAKAVAGEAKVPFFSIAGSEFVEMFVGRGAARVRDLFAQARKAAPCIVFIDEIDTIGKKRDGGGFNGNDEREQTLNQLLAELDGFDGSKGIILLGATNRPETLDPALTRPGRFDRRVPVELPDFEGRRAILELHAQNVRTDSNIDYDMIARASAGTSGADLANIINEGALLAVRDNRKKVGQRDLEEAIEIVIAGEKKKNKIMSDKERMIVAYHEIGHALVSACSKHAAPVHKITIIPRTKGALGYTMQIDEEENNLLSRDELFTRIVTYCGGRAAEDLIFNSITSGASNDIEMATRTARMMVTRLGMSDEFGMMALETINNAYLGGDSSLACSEQTASRIDKEVKDLIDKAYKEAYSILQANIMKLHELAKYLYEKETITGEEFMEILDKETPVPSITYNA